MIRGSTYLRIFSSRCGSKWFLIVAPVSLLLFAALGSFSIVMLWLFLAVVVTRLNDIGASRWHVAWFAALAIITKLVLMAPVSPSLPLDQKQVALGFVELVELILLLGLATIPGCRETNRFGPPPLRLREVFGVRNAARAYRRTASEQVQEMKASSAQLTACAARLRTLRESWATPGQPAWRREELALQIKAEEANFAAIQTRFQQAADVIKPDQEAVRSALDRQAAVLRYQRRSD